MGEAITVVRLGAPTGTLDRRNRPVLGADVETVISGWLFAPAGSVEQIGTDRRKVLTRDTLYRRGAADVVADDRVIVRGVEREVDGDPQVWRDPSGRTVGVVVQLKTVEG